MSCLERGGDWWIFLYDKLQFMNASVSGILSVLHLHVVSLNDDVSSFAYFLPLVLRIAFVFVFELPVTIFRSICYRFS